MKVIIAGSRGILDFNILADALAEFDESVDEVVSGGAMGVDKMGELWARETGTALKVFPADWKKYGPAAGPIRNQQMADYADALIAIWDGKSRGTHNMIETAKRKGLKVYVYKVLA